MANRFLSTIKKGAQSLRNTYNAQVKAADDRYLASIAAVRTRVEKERAKVALKREKVALKQELVNAERALQHEKDLLEKERRAAGIIPFSERMRKTRESIEKFNRVLAGPPPRKRRVTKKK